MKQGEQFWEEQFPLLPNLYKELCGEDEKTGLIWMPNTVNLPNKGMVFAEGQSAEKWVGLLLKQFQCLKKKKKHLKLKVKITNSKWI
jgi:hypothetical protein